MFFWRKWPATRGLILGKKSARLIFGGQPVFAEKLGIGKISGSMSNNDWLFLEGQAIPIVDNTHAVTSKAEVLRAPVHMSNNHAPGAMQFTFLRPAGYFVDPSARPEIAGFADQILLWRDRYVPPADQEDPFLGNHPYLGEGHEYLEKSPGQALYLRDIHVHNPAGFVSFGVPVGDVPSMRRDIPLVTARISRDLFLADLDIHEQRMTGTIAADFPDATYASAVRRRGKAN